MTASSGLDTAEMISGAGNSGTPMPTISDHATAMGYVAAGATYTGNLQIDTIIAAFNDAQFAVLMLGTNDASGPMAVATFTSNLTTIISKLEAQHIVVILSTITPHINQTDLVHGTYNPAIRALAQTMHLPLIDFEAEILARQPSTWSGTLIEAKTADNDGLHPSSAWGAYHSASNPYAEGGNASTHTTGGTANNIGYLLRSWLTVQKMKEVKSSVVDGAPPALSITTSSPLLVATVGMLYNTTITASNVTGTASWSIISGSLPSGLTISSSGVSSSGVISGTPVAAGAYNFTVQVADTAPATASKAFSLTVQPATVYLISGAITGLLFPADNISVAYSGDKSGTVTTTDTGIYTIGNLENGDAITITPATTGTGYTFSPGSDLRTIVSANITGVNFVAADANSDGDGLPDAWEIHYFYNTTTYSGTDDPDNDTVNNATEYANHTDPMAGPTKASGSDGGCIPGAACGFSALMWLACVMLLDWSRC